MTLKPWREVVAPHPDVAAGRYRQAEFAADLADVLASSTDTDDKTYADHGAQWARAVLGAHAQLALA